MKSGRNAIGFFIAAAFCWNQYAAAEKAAIQSAGAPSTLEKEAVLMVVTRWNADCSASNVGAWDDMLDGWYDEISNDGRHGSEAWNRESRQKNGEIVDSDFTDRDEVSWGNDYGGNNPDDVDAVMIGMHGGHWSGTPGPWTGSVRVDEAVGGDCGANQSDIVLGDVDLEFLHLSSCHSLCDAGEDWYYWPASFDGLHQMNGFYGIMYISKARDDDYKDFARDAFDIAIADAWVDELFDPTTSSGQDQCPVSLAVGGSESAASHRISNEEYDYVFDDPPSTGKFLAIGISGCDPLGHNP